MLPVFNMAEPQPDSLITTRLPDSRGSARGGLAPPRSSAAFGPSPFLGWMQTSRGYGAVPRANHAICGASDAIGRLSLLYSVAPQDIRIGIGAQPR